MARIAKRESVTAQSFESIVCHAVEAHRFPNAVQAKWGVHPACPREGVGSLSYVGARVRGNHAVVESVVSWQRCAAHASINVKVRAPVAVQSKQAGSESCVQRGPTSSSRRVIFILVAEWTLTLAGLLRPALT